MNDQIQELLKTFLDIVNTGVNFAKDQTPLVIKEFIAWGIAEHTFFVVAFGLISIVCLCIGPKAFKKAHDNDWNDSGLASIVLFLVSVILGIISIIEVLYNAYEGIKITVAPGSS